MNEVPKASHIFIIQIWLLGKAYFWVKKVQTPKINSSLHVK